MTEVSKERGTLKKLKAHWITYHYWPRLDLLRGNPMKQSKDLSVIQFLLGSYPHRVYHFTTWVFKIAGWWIDPFPLILNVPPY